MTFQPRGSTKCRIVCTNNLGKDVNYLANQEYTLTKEKQDLRLKDSNYTAASDQATKDANTGDATDATAAETARMADKSTASAAEEKKPGKGNRKKDPEVMRLNEQRQKEMKMQTELEYRQTQLSVYHLLTKDAAKKPQDGFGGNSSMVGSSSLGSGFNNNKMPPEGLIGQPEDKKKTIVVLSNKEVG